jgi:hypothetical protein
VARKDLPIWDVNVPVVKDKEQARELLVRAENSLIANSRAGNNRSRHSKDYPQRDYTLTF